MSTEEWQEACREMIREEMAKPKWKRKLEHIQFKLSCYFHRVLWESGIVTERNSCWFRDEDGKIKARYTRSR